LTYTVQVNDTSNNYFLGSQQTKSVTDNDAPLISDVSAVPASQIVDGYVNITANVSDNINLNSVMVAITGPSGFTPVNDSMDNAGGDVHYYYENYSIVGIYNYSIWANDSSDNSVTSATYQFEIVAEILVTNLSVKWNFISLPFNQTVNKTDLIFHYNGTDYNWTEAIDPANGPLIDYFIYGWNRGPSGQIYQTVDVLRTWIIILDVRLLWLYTEEIVIFKTNMNNRKASY
jgi:hypothetical protein